MYKCCWNCEHGMCGWFDNEEVRQLCAASVRFCCAPYPVSNYAQNPFKKRYCKQYLEKEVEHPLYRNINGKDANRLKSMSAQELSQFWKDDFKKRQEDVK